MKGSPATGRWIGVFLALLIVSRLAVLAPGFGHLLEWSDAVDLDTRRTELEWVRLGVDPVLAVERVRAAKGHAPRVAKPLRSLAKIDDAAFEAVDPGRVRSNQVAYPPWSYPLMAPLIWPPWPATRVYYAVVALAALVGVLAWARRLLDGVWGWGAVFVCLLPASSWAVGFHLGQLSAPVLLALMLFAGRLAAGRAWSGGAILGWSAVKPTSTALFAVLLLAPRFARRASWRWVGKATLAAATVVSLATAAVWARVGTSPWHWLEHLRQAGTVLDHQGYGLLPLLERVAPASSALLPVAVAGVLPFVLHRLRDAGLLVQMALVGLAARLWTYHQHWDDLLLVFLLLALLVEVRRGSVLSLLALLATATTLATPTPSSEAMGLWRVLVWGLSAAVLVCEHLRAGEALARDPDSPRAVLLDGRRGGISS